MTVVRFFHGRVSAISCASTGCCYLVLKTWTLRILAPDATHARTSSSHSGSAHARAAVPAGGCPDPPVRGIASTSSRLLFINPQTPKAQLCAGKSFRRDFHFCAQLGAKAHDRRRNILPAPRFSIQHGHFFVNSTVKTIIFWVFILACLVVLWLLFQKR
jgi:hypothetical protein